MQHKTPYVARKKRKYVIIKWKNIIVTIFLLCFCVCACVCFLAVNSRKLIVLPQNFYYLQCGEYLTLVEANSKSLEIQASGGAGYIYEEDNVKVMASVYFSSADAEKVCLRLNSQGINTIVYAISSPKIKIKMQKTKALNNQLTQAINYPIELFNNLYKTILQLDTNKISIELALLQTKVYATQTKNLMTNYIVSDCIELKNLEKMYEEIYFSLKQIEDSSVKNTSAKLKMSLCKIANAIIQGYTKISL